MKYNETNEVKRKHDFIERKEKSEEVRESVCGLMVKRRNESLIHSPFPTILVQPPSNPTNLSSLFLFCSIKTMNEREWKEACLIERNEQGTPWFFPPLNLNEKKHAFVPSLSSFI